ncbi:UDP-N-acetyl-D-mannosaminuronic acid dehydrogenase [Crossiella equi]|uniref:UDP-N-acetyl-D-mannosaminuronic acid dehydrogenase n=1 Tax=Crossiella equi TaxID=130796 RepID=A0ABS5AAB5_9PSEU|nr:nucleotide sugar dehydrogenase [Crossiella equi]MBP2473518.1 UDP-N-acetyl-D-mannosaminuronic acid dehydrogenase [Crossiella equi]
MRFLPGRGTPTASVLGLGYVGSCVAATLAGNGIRVTGLDVDTALVEEVRSGRCRFREAGLPELLARVVADGLLTATTDYAEAARADVVIVAVGTPIHDGGTLRDTQLRAACEELSGHLRPGQLVVLKSTVPPGMTRSLVVPLLERGGLVAGADFGLVFSPERLSEGAALAELNRFPIVVGGLGADSVEAACAFWRLGIGVEVIRCASLEAAELVKLADNWWIDHNIALANELAKLCGALAVDVLDVIAGANSITKGEGNVNILLPSVGVGGSCLTKDPWMVWRRAAELGVELRTIPVARAVNDGMPAFTADLVLAELPVPEQARVAVLGLAFKSDTGDLRATPVAPVVDALRRAGAEVVLHDPLVDPDEAVKVFGQAPVSSVDEAVRGASVIAVLAGHAAYDDLDFARLRELAAPACTVVDGRAYYAKETIEMLGTLGFAYRGIGR